MFAINWGFFKAAGFRLNKQANISHSWIEQDFKSLGSTPSGPAAILDGISSRLLKMMIIIHLPSIHPSTVSLPPHHQRAPWGRAQVGRAETEPQPRVGSPEGLRGGDPASQVRREELLLLLPRVVLLLNILSCLLCVSLQERAAWRPVRQSWRVPQEQDDHHENHRAAHQWPGPLLQGAGPVSVCVCACTPDQNLKTSQDIARICSSHR